MHFHSGVAVRKMQACAALFRISQASAVAAAVAIEGASP